MALGVGKANISEMRICQKLICFLRLGYLHCENAIATHETVEEAAGIRQIFEKLYVRGREASIAAYNSTSKVNGETQSLLFCCE